MRKLLLAATVAMGAPLLLASAAQAAPLLEGEVFDNGTLVGSVQSSSSGALTFSTTDAFFSSIQVTADGIPIVPSPDLASQTTRVSTASGFSGTHNVVIEVTQTGITGFTGAMAFANSFAANFLIGSTGVTGDTLSNYIDASNTAFATTTLLGSTTCTAPSTCATPTSNSTQTVSGPFSETEIFAATFTAGGSTLQSNAQITGSAVPEPASLALLGSALVGFGVIRRRRRS